MTAVIHFNLAQTQTVRITIFFLLLNAIFNGAGARVEALFFHTFVGFCVDG